MKVTERCDDKEFDLYLINAIELMSSNECHLLELSYWKSMCLFQL